MIITKEKKNAYLAKVYNEMERRGFTTEEIPVVISMTGFLSALEEYPEEQFHYDVSDAVDEILVTTAKKAAENYLKKPTTSQMFESFYGKSFEEITQEDIGPAFISKQNDFFDDAAKENSAESIICDVAKREDHAELINGKLVVSDKTSVSHHDAVFEIASALKDFVAANSCTGEVFTQNIALYCNELCDGENLFLPDVMFVNDENSIQDDGVHGVPVFVVEVTSEISKKYDFAWKMVTYAEIGVKEYWIVDPPRKEVTRYLLKNEYVPEIFTYPNVKVLALDIFPSLELDLSRVFKWMEC